MTRRTKLSATALAIVLMIAAVGAFAVPVSAGEKTSDGPHDGKATDGHQKGGDAGAYDACDYVIRVGSIDASLEDSTIAGPGLPDESFEDDTFSENNIVVVVTADELEDMTNGDMTNGDEPIPVEVNGDEFDGDAIDGQKHHDDAKNHQGHYKAGDGQKHHDGHHKSGDSTNTRFVLIVESAQASLDDVTVEDNSEFSAEIGSGELTISDVYIAGPGLPNADIDEETVTIPAGEFDLDGDGDNETTVNEPLDVTIENVTVRDTSDRCDAGNGQKVHDGHDKSGDGHQKDHNDQKKAHDGHQKHDDQKKAHDGKEKHDDQKKAHDGKEKHDDRKKANDDRKKANNGEEKPGDDYDNGDVNGDDTTTENDDYETTEDDSADSEAMADRTETDGPGFGLVAAVIAMLGAALLAVRRSS